MNNEEMIDAYIRLRDRRALRKKAFESDDEPDKGHMDKIETVMLKRLHESGLTSFSCKGVGTAYMTTLTSVTAADGEMFVTFCVDNGLMHLVERRPAKKAIEDYVAETQIVPPGLNINRKISVNIKRA